MSTTARTSSGDLQLPRVILTAPAQVAQQTAIDVLSLWQGTWFLDLLGGVPWFSVLGVKNPSIALAKYILRQAILSVPYVVSVMVDVYFDAATRNFAYAFNAPLSTGEVLTGGSSQPFTIQQAPGSN